MSENLAGTTLKERYELLEQLGSGGFGTIYTAKDTSTAINGVYVVKHFSPHYGNQAQLDTAMRLFRQEADSLKELGNHPQIPRIIDFFNEDEQFFLVQELIEGKNLEQELANLNHFNQNQLVKLLTDVLKVLIYIHGSGYIHRDIKPSNLIRNSLNNEVFVIDFGAVKEKIDPKNISTAGKFSRTVGILSPGYTPEEQLHGEPEFCSDIYALGMVAVEALTKVNPQKLGRDANNGWQLVWRDFLIPHVEYAPSLLDLIDKMVAKDWQNRYQSATEVIADLEQITLQSTVIPNSEPEVVPSEVKSNSFLPLGLLKIFAGLGVASAIAIPSWLIFNNSQSNFVTYENEHIQIDYPKTWSRETNSNFLGDSVSFVSPQEDAADNFQERVTVSVGNSSRPLSLTEYTKQAVIQIENLDNFIMLSPKPIKVGNTVGKYAIYQGNERDVKVKRYEVWTVNYKKIYTVVYTSEPDKYSEFFPVAEQMIQSLKIL